MRLGLSRYRGSRRCHRLGTVRIWVTPETSPQSLATDPRKQGQGSALDPPKADGLWKPFIFDHRDPALTL